MMTLRVIWILSLIFFSCQDSKVPGKIPPPQPPETDQVQTQFTKLADLGAYLKLPNQALKNPGTWSELEVLPWPTYGVGMGITELPYSKPYQMDQFLDVALRWIEKQTFQDSGKIEFISQEGKTFSLRGKDLKEDAYFREYLRPDSDPNSEQEIWSVFLPLVTAPPFSGQTWTVKVFHGEKLVKVQDFKLDRGFMMGDIKGYLTSEPSLIRNLSDIPSTNRESKFLFLQWKTEAPCFLVLYQKSEKLSPLGELWIPLALGEFKQPTAAPQACEWNLNQEKEYLLIATTDPQKCTKYDLTEGLKL